MKRTLLIASLVAIAGCRTQSNDSEILGLESPEQKPTYICFDRDSEQKLIEVKETEVVAHTRPNGVEVFEVALTVDNREVQGIGNVNDDRIDVSASDPILGDIILKSRPQSEEAAFNVLQMLGDIKHVRCLRLHEEPVDPEPAASGSNQ